jgi:uncharacterized protein YceK
MKTILITIVALLLLAGCATTNKGESGGFLQRHSGAKKVAHAVNLLDRGDSAGAVKELNAVCAASPMAGVTDEALFRLALLSLKPSVEKPASAQGHALLKRLKKEFPDSPWTAQAAPLFELIGVADELKHQNKSLKATTQSLTKEINELNKNINQLKHLDLELEQKTR